MSLTSYSANLRNMPPNLTKFRAKYDYIVILNASICMSE